MVAGGRFLCRTGIVPFVGVMLFWESNDPLAFSSWRWRAFRLLSSFLWSKLVVSKSSESLSCVDLIDSARLLRVCWSSDDGSAEEAITFAFLFGMASRS